LQLNAAPPNPDAIRALIIDDSPDMRLLVGHYLLVEWPTAQIEEWDPLERGKPDFGFDWSRYDVVLLDYRLGMEDGLAWLKEFKQSPECPPIIFMTGQGSEDIAVRALKAGAADYLRKHDMSQGRMVASIKDAIAAAASVPPPSKAESFLTTQAFGRNIASVRGSLASEVRARKALDELDITGYWVRRKIGSGGMSSVYLAERDTDKAPIVLKVLDAELSYQNEFLQRFIREYGILSKLAHRNVVRIYDQGYSDEHVYIAMEYFSGGDLKARIDRGIAPAEAIAIFKQIANGLQAIHAAEVVHRDLKPQNIMFRPDGSLAILDFGIAKIASEETQLTEHGQVFGTPYYMSPEQGTGSRLDGRSDLYSAGVILYEMLTGKKLFSADNAVALVYKHLHDEIPLLTAPLSRFQDLLDRIVAKKPEDRFQSAASLSNYLSQHFSAEAH
jgi:eukaryotic-like serine/threonine-protein kinase